MKKIRDIKCGECKWLIRLGMAGYACFLKSDLRKHIFEEVHPLGEGCQFFEKRVLERRENLEVVDS